MTPDPVTPAAVAPDPVAPAPVTPESRIRLHDLAVRQDGSGWIVGRVATGEFVGLPPEAMTFLGVLRGGGTVGAAKRQTDLLHGEDTDALGFVGDLIDLGFVAAVDGEVMAGEEPRAPSLRWLRPRHVSWLFRAPVELALAAFICAGVVVAAVSGSLPGYTAFFALPEPGLSIALVVVIAIALTALHEFCHLAAARAADVHGWFGWSTRLWYLVAQTSVPGLWMASRSVRLRVFLAGMTSDLVIFSACSMGMRFTASAGTAHHVLALTCLITLLSVLDQFLFFMRTDVYLVIQELTGCKNLFGDATDYLRYLAGRRLRRAGAAARPDPLPGLPAAERRPVRVYAAVVVAGCAVMVAVSACYVVPIDISIYLRAARELAGGLSSSRIALAADAIAAIGVTLFFHALLVRTLLRTYRPHLRVLWHRAGRLGLAGENGPAAGT
jgi:putative peptide zinc metalloprotease protein